MSVSIETKNFNFPLVCALSLVKLTYKSDGALHTEYLADDGYPDRRTNNNNNFSGSLRHFLRNSPLGTLGSLL